MRTALLLATLMLAAALSGCTERVRFNLDANSDLGRDFDLHVRILDSKGYAVVDETYTVRATQGEHEARVLDLFEIRAGTYEFWAEADNRTFSETRDLDSSTIRWRVVVLQESVSFAWLYK